MARRAYDVLRTDERTEEHGPIPPVKRPNDPLARRLRAARSSSRLSIRQLAEELDVDKSTVQSWMQGRYKPRLDQIEPLAACLGVRVSVLLGETTDVIDSSPTRRTTPSEAEALVIRLADEDLYEAANRLASVVPQLMEVLDAAQKYVQRER